MKQQAIKCEQLHTEIDRPQVTTKCAAGVQRELFDQFIVARDGKPPWSTKAFVHTVRNIQHHEIVSSGICADEFREKGPQQWMKLASSTLEEATESYMVETIAKSHF